jgi:hypothetical protein
VHRHHALRPDERAGYVDEKRNVHRAVKLGRDQQAGRIDANGEIYAHVPDGEDLRVGKVTGKRALLEGAAALLLLLTGDNE